MQTKANRIVRLLPVLIVLTGAIALSLFAHAAMKHLSPIRRCFGVLSPDSNRIAAVECCDQGSLGGRTYVYILSRSEKNPTPDVKHGNRIIDLPHLYPHQIEICWMDNDTLVFNGAAYEIE